jgi:hypothetical protein
MNRAVRMDKTEFRVILLYFLRGGYATNCGWNTSLSDESAERYHCRVRRRPSANPTVTS